MNYAFEQYLFGIVYLLVMLSTSTVCGYIVSQLRSGIDKRGLFAIGFSFAPCVVGSWVIIFSFFPIPYYKQYLCVAFLLLLQAYILFRLHQSHVKIGRALFAFSKNNIVFIVWVILIVAILAWTLVGISGVQVYFDASFYMAEALKFVKSLSFRDIATHRDFVGGTLQGSVHNFLWPGFISFGMLFSGPGEYGLGNDFSAYVSIILTAVYLIVALWGVLVTVTKNIKVSSAVSLLIVFSPFISCINIYSRDLFRCIPLIIFIALLYIDLHYTIKGKHLLLFNLLLAFDSYYIMGGHPINAFTAAVVGICWMILSKKNNVQFVYKCAFIFLGVLIGSYNFIYAFIDTGTITGYCSLYPENIYQGTSIYSVAMEEFASTMVTDSNIVALMRSIFSGDKYYVCTIALFCSIFSLATQIRRRSMGVFIPMVYLCSFLMIALGLLIKWGEFAYAEWLSRNKRYMYQFYILGLICIGQFVMEVSCMMQGRKLFRDKLTTFGSVSSIAVMILAVVFLLVSYNPVQKRINNIEKYNKEGKIIYDLYTGLGKGEKILISENQYSYVTDVNALVLASHFGEPLFRAEGAREVYDFLIENGIKYVCLNSVYRTDFWKDAVFYKSILEMCDTGLMNEVDPNVYMVMDSRKQTSMAS